jgi:hypothetical protein
MASDASVKNIENLRQFGRNLKMTSDNLIQVFQKLTIQMHAVCEGWNDSKNQAFMADFEQKAKMIGKLSQEMQVYSQFIAKTCDVLDQYRSIK